jgi:hypothetical protein
MEGVRRRTSKERGGTHSGATNLEFDGTFTLLDFDVFSILSKR